MKHWKRVIDMFVRTRNNDEFVKMIQKIKWLFNKKGLPRQESLCYNNKAVYGENRKYENSYREVER